MEQSDKNNAPIIEETPIIEERNEEIEPVEFFFTPHTLPEMDFKTLGLLGKMVSNHCLLQYFRMPPIEVEICRGIRKLFAWHDNLQEECKAEEKEPLTEEELPNLWIISTYIPDELLELFNAKNQLSDWCQGVYITEEGFQTGLVSIDRLPDTFDTLWLRLLGIGKTQEQAITQLLALPQENPLRNKILDFIGSWWIETQKEEEITEEYEELFAVLSPIYQQWQKENDE
ncbi:MAG: hypothetical protein KAI83_05975 [Thiomargarita sp.]|nr:hypothetical protein [Thiomargarita sp.]